MAHPHFADGGTASSIEGSSEYSEKSVLESRRSLVLQLEEWASC